MCRNRKCCHKVNAHGLLFHLQGAFRQVVIRKEVVFCDYLMDCSVHDRIQLSCSSRLDKALGNYAAAVRKAHHSKLHSERRGFGKMLQMLTHDLWISVVALFHGTERRDVQTLLSTCTMMKHLRYRRFDCAFLLKLNYGAVGTGRNNK